MKKKTKQRIINDLTSSNLSIKDNFTARFAEEIEHKLNNPFERKSNRELWADSSNLNRHQSISIK